MVAVTALAAAAVFLILPRPKTPTPTPAQNTRPDLATSEKPGAELDETNDILEMANGSVRVDVSGARVSVLQAPTGQSPLSPPRGAARLRRGRAKFAVEKQTAPFILHTSHFSVRVLGAVFHVETDDTNSEIHIDQGSVTVKSGQEEMHLSPGMSFRMEGPGTAGGRRA